MGGFAGQSAQIFQMLHGLFVWLMQLALWEFRGQLLIRIPVSRSFCHHSLCSVGAGSLHVGRSVQFLFAEFAGDERDRVIHG